jgi:hypothetical protein
MKKGQDLLNKIWLRFEKLEGELLEVSDRHGNKVTISNAEFFTFLNAPQEKLRNFLTDNGIDVTLTIKDMEKQSEEALKKIEGEFNNPESSSPEQTPPEL